jgi:hypothetical protein
MSQMDPVCNDCAEQMAPRMWAVVALWKSAPAEQLWPITPSDSGKDPAI